MTPNTSAREIGAPAAKEPVIRRGKFETGCRRSGIALRCLRYYRVRAANESAKPTTSRTNASVVSQVFNELNCDCIRIALSAPYPNIPTACHKFAVALFTTLIFVTKSEKLVHVYSRWVRRLYSEQAHGPYNGLARELAGEFSMDPTSERPLREYFRETPLPCVLTLVIIVDKSYAKRIHKSAR